MKTLLLFLLISFGLLSQKNKSKNPCENQETQLLNYSNSVKEYESRLIEKDNKIILLNDSINDIIIYMHSA